MCGRLTQHWTIKDWNQVWAAEWRADRYRPRYNVAPGTEVLALVKSRQGPVVGGLLYWGLPNPRGGLVINARAETLFSRPMFRPLLSNGRAVVPMNGYYEWHHETHQPYYLTDKHSPLWALALYRRDTDRARLVIITRPASRMLESLHPRMPLLADRELAEGWLSDQGDIPRGVLDHLMAFDTPGIEVVPVSRTVNSSRNEGPELIRPLTEDA
ncbi:SOS response-associated peptidase [Sulfobacillus harzensis]|uniref:Abasic site processing protein n=1 Tax=Sulfobacillus harzensis TaxID=2729629 RepID=A0A7Y0L5L7_9FIRM|nr:SOS response-associated peptidase [Sulfobacillus harzensis]NMP22314.1 SOS response-associated peptidase [Sulfobacillus harzensis]